MKKQVVQDFLNRPGIVGLALMDGHSRPYFCGIDQSLNFQQKEVLAQGIQQVISTTPEDFEVFNFRFSQRDAYLYKLDGGVILLVITDEALDGAAYQEAVIQLKQTLKTDSQSTVSTFRLLAGGTTLSKQQYWSGGQGDLTRPPENTEEIPSAQNLKSEPSAQVNYRWEQSIDALNLLTDATARYLGKIVVANAWRSTRPTGRSVENLQIDRKGHFSYLSADEADSSQLICPEDYDILCSWVQQFIQRCSQVIRDYPEIVLNQALNDQQRAILRIENSSD